MDRFEELSSQLASRLRELRQAAGLTGIELGGRLGWTQSKVSKIETGRTLPSAADVAAWVGITGGGQVLPELVDLLTEVRDAQHQWRVRFRRGQAAVQREFDELGKAASVIRTFETAAIPGLLQTADYARLRMMEGVRRQGADPAKIDDSLAARVQRHQIIYDTTKRFEFLLAEPVLRWRLAPPDVMRGQLNRILSLSGLPNVTVAVLPFDVPLDDTPQHGFILFDDIGKIETLTQDVTSTGDGAATLAAVFDEYMAKALTGSHARQIIAQAIDALPQE